MLLFGGSQNIVTRDSGTQRRYCMLHNYDTDQKMNLAFIGTCVKGVAHNINTPLSAIMGRAEMLQMRLNKIKATGGATVSVEDIEKCLKDTTLIIENSIKVSEIVKNAMKKSIGAESLKQQPVRIDTLLKDELTFLQADMFYKHSVEKIITIQEPVPPLQGVPVHFSNSFLEIIDNSLHALQDAAVKKLTVTVSSNEQEICLVFHDTGCGMDAGTRERLYSVLCSGADADGVDKGMQRVARLLRPYGARFDIQSSQGNTAFSVRLPVATT